MTVRASGVGPTMLVLVAVVGLGLAISVPPAPETRGVVLDEAGRAGTSDGGSTLVTAGSI